MSDVHIIYTPNAGLFKLDDLWMNLREGLQAEDPRVISLRDNYDRLKERFPEMPSEVGVATYGTIPKRESDQAFEERANDPFIKHATSYAPLDILETALGFRSEDVGDPATGEMVYRAFSYLVMDRAFSPRAALPDDIHTTLLFASFIPKIEGVKIRFREGLQGAVKGGVPEEKTSLLRNILAPILDAYPDRWSSLERAYDFYKAMFEADQVSREFPLYFHPPGSFYPSLYRVDLRGGVECPEILMKAIEYVEMGCRSEGLDHIPENVMESMVQMKRDRFGATASANSMEELLDGLPMPKTIITDIYIVDRFPELKGRIQTSEYGHAVNNFK